jgi:hypothetical protein
MAEEKQVNKFVFTREEVAEILARFIMRVRGDYLVGERIEVGTYDIVLITDAIE